jgi:hypothetical protein
VSKLYIFGDSYSTPEFCVDPKDSWWGLLANAIGSKIEGVDNYSWPGNNIDSIAHIIVANQDMFRPDDYIVIGIPPIERMTVFDPGARLKQVVKYDPKLNEVRRSMVPRHESLQQLTAHQLDRAVIELWNRSWQEAQVLRSILTLAAYIEKITTRYMFLNLAEPFQPATTWSVLQSLQQQTTKHRHMIVFENTYYSVNFNVNRPADFETYGWHGHHGTEGNKHWFNTAILPNAKELNWVQ